MEIIDEPQTCPWGARTSVSFSAVKYGSPWYNISILLILKEERVFIILKNIDVK